MRLTDNYDQFTLDYGDFFYRIYCECIIWYHSDKLNFLFIAKRQTSKDQKNPPINGMKSRKDMQIIFNHS